MAYIGQSLTEGTRRVYTYVATASQTTFNAVYGVGAVDVYQNGVLLQPSDYTASDGTSVVLGTGAALSDEITIVCHNTFSVADTVSASQGGTFSEPVTVEGDGDTVLTVDRATSNGTIIDVQKDGSTVGSIGIAENDTLTISNTGSSPSTLYLRNDNKIIPKTDNVMDIGRSAQRFKDLYLSGGVYLGGTGSANKLDDYEEGTYTMTLTDNSGNTSSSSYNTRYTKIGNMVTIEQYMLNISTTGMTSGDVVYFSLPFVGSSSRYYVGGCISDNITFSSGRTQIQTRSNGSTSYGVFRESGSGVSDAAVTWSKLTASSSDIFITLHYRTTA